MFEKSGYTKLKESLRLRMDDLNIRFDKDELLRRFYEDTVRIPILGPISDDTLFFVTETSKEYLFAKEYNAVEVARSLLPSRETGNNLYALEVVGNGMSDAMVFNGDIVVLRPAKEVRNGERAVLRISGEFTLKYFYREKNRYRLQPANPEMKPIFAKERDSIEVVAKVVMVIRKVKPA